MKNLDKALANNPTDAEVEKALEVIARRYLVNEINKADGLKLVNEKSQIEILENRLGELDHEFYEEFGWKIMDKAVDLLNRD